MYSQTILTLFDVPWVLFFLIGAAAFGYSFRGKWISRKALTGFLLFKMMLCIGMSTWLISTDQDFDSAGYYMSGQPYAARFVEWVTGQSTEYLEVTPFFGRGDGDSTARFNSLTGLLLGLTGNSFMACALTLCCLGAIGQLLIFRYLVTRFQFADQRYFYLILFHPSSALWSGLLLKDSLGMLALGLMIYNLDRLLVHYRWSNLLLFALGCYTALNFRSFILVMIFVFLLFAIWDRRIQPAAWKAERGGIIAIFYISSAITLSFLLLIYFVQNYGSDMIELQSNTDAIYSQIQGGSSFKNADMSFSGGGVLALLVGVVNTLLRPYLWEARSLTQAAAAIENTLVLLVVIYGWWVYFVRINKDQKRYSRSIIWGALLMTVICASGVGLFSSNLGSISRYRTPVIPLFLAGPCVAMGLALYHARMGRSRGLSRKPI